MAVAGPDALIEARVGPVDRLAIVFAPA